MMPLPWEIAEQQALAKARARVDKVILALRQKGASNDYCPRCSSDDWSVDFLQIPAAPWREPNSTSPGFFQAPVIAFNSNIQVVAIQCKNCGYILFHNLA